MFENNKVELSKNRHDKLLILNLFQTIMAFVRCLAFVHLMYRFKRIHRIGSTFLMKIAATYLFATSVTYFLVAYTLSAHDSLRSGLLSDSWFLIILFVDLPRVTRMAQFALSSSHQR